MPNVADLELGKPDGLGGTVQLIYGRNAPYYGVFRSETRVLVQFADARDLAADQRKAMAPLNPLRGEINGLTEDWRGAADWQGGRKAECYDRRVADALVVAFEGDVPTAQALLEQIKADVLADRTALARLQYVIAASVVVILVVLLASWLAGTVTSTDPNSASAQTKALYEAARAGSLGALFSIALGIRSRTVLPDLQKLANSLDAVLRVVIGVIAASLLIGMLMADIVEVSIGKGEVTAASWLPIFVFAFLAGFSERMVPDLLSKVATRFDVAAATPVKAVAKPGGPTPAGGGAGGGAGTGGSGAGGGGGGSPAPQALAAPDDDPLPEEAAHDACACEIDVKDDENTPDDQLPPASGGVAAGGGAG